jgi:hypothetical protein
VEWTPAASVTEAVDRDGERLAPSVSGVRLLETPAYLRLRVDA